MASQRPNTSPKPRTTRGASLTSVSSKGAPATLLTAYSFPFEILNSDWVQVGPASWMMEVPKTTQIDKPWSTIILVVNGLLRTQLHQIHRTDSVALFLTPTNKALANPTSQHEFEELKKERPTLVHFRKWQSAIYVPGRAGCSLLRSPCVWNRHGSVSIQPSESSHQGIWLVWSP